MDPYATAGEEAEHVLELEEDSPLVAPAQAEEGAHREGGGGADLNAADAHAAVDLQGFGQRRADDEQDGA